VTQNKQFYTHYDDDDDDDNDDDDEGRFMRSQMEPTMKWWANPIRKTNKRV